jgi:hypothetical protein
VYFCTDQCFSVPIVLYRYLVLSQIGMSAFKYQSVISCTDWILSVSALPFDRHTRISIVFHGYSWYFFHLAHFPLTHREDYSFRFVFKERSCSVFLSLLFCDEVLRKFLQRLPALAGLWAILSIECLTFHPEWASVPKQVCNMSFKDITLGAVRIIPFALLPIWTTWIECI